MKSTNKSSLACSSGDIPRPTLDRRICAGRVVEVHRVGGSCCNAMGRHSRAVQVTPLTMVDPNIALGVVGLHENKLTAVVTMNTRTLEEKKCCFRESRLMGGEEMRGVSGAAENSCRMIQRRWERAWRVGRLCLGWDLAWRIHRSPGRVGQQSDRIEVHPLANDFQEIGNRD